MKKYLLDCDAFRLKKNKTVTEGGMSRNHTIRNYLVEKLGYKAITTSGNSTISAIQIIFFFLLHRHHQIFVMYPTRFFLMGGTNKANRILGNLAVRSYIFGTKRNRVLMDVSDIKYEQLIDLEIPCPDLNLVEDRERKVFTSESEFIFASSSMKDFAIEKYKIDRQKCDVCINGGRKQKEKLEPEVESFKNGISHDVINCVYAGTLNKGRLIDKMLDCFCGLESAKLYLMGPMGEWIEDYLTSNSIHNVYYLGSKDERIAHQIVSQCDVGLIPYDEGRLYYNIAYPTKLSFYITAGIPYLSTPVKEVMMIQEMRIGYVGSIEDWQAVLSGITKEEITKTKERVKGQRNEFTWDSIMSKCALMNS